MKYLLVSFAFVSVICLVLGTGEHQTLSTEDLNDVHIKGLANQGVSKVKEQKKAQNSLPSCVDLDGELLSGTKQVVAGFNYNFNIKVTPKKSANSECAAQNVDLSSVPTENCAVNIWEKPGGQEVVITVNSCESIYCE